MGWYRSRISSVSLWTSKFGVVLILGCLVTRKSCLTHVSLCLYSDSLVSPTLAALPCCRVLIDGEVYSLHGTLSLNPLIELFLLRFPARANALLWIYTVHHREIVRNSLTDTGLTNYRTFTLWVLTSCHNKPEVLLKRVATYCTILLKTLLKRFNIIVNQKRVFYYFSTFWKVFFKINTKNAI